MVERHSDELDYFIITLSHTPTECGSIEIYKNQVSTHIRDERYLQTNMLFYWELGQR